MADFAPVSKWRRPPRHPFKSFVVSCERVDIAQARGDRALVK